MYLKTRTHSLKAEIMEQFKHDERKKMQKLAELEEKLREEYLDEKITNKSERDNLRKEMHKMEQDHLLQEEMLRARLAAADREDGESHPMGQMPVYRDSAAAIMGHVLGTGPKLTGKHHPQDESDAFYL